MSDWYQDGPDGIWLKDRTPMNPDFAVYYDLIRGWCWDAFDTYNDPIDGARGFESAAAAMTAADLWLNTKEE